MAKITIKRNLSFLGYPHSYKIFINDKAEALVRNNSSRTMELDPGVYRLRVGIGKFNTRSNQLYVNVDEDSELLFTAKMNAWLIYGFLIAFAGLELLHFFVSDGNLPMIILGILFVIGGFAVSSLYAVKLKRVTK